MSVVVPVNDKFIPACGSLGNTPTAASNPTHKIRVKIANLIIVKTVMILIGVYSRTTEHKIPSCKHHIAAGLALTDVTLTAVKSVAPSTEFNLL